MKRIAVVIAAMLGLLAGTALGAASPRNYAADAGHHRHQVPSRIYFDDTGSSHPGVVRIRPGHRVLATGTRRLVFENNCHLDYLEKVGNASLAWQRVWRSHLEAQDNGSCYLQLGTLVHHKTYDTCGGRIQIIDTDDAMAGVFPIWRTRQTKYRCPYRLEIDKQGDLVEQSYPDQGLWVNEWRIRG